MIFIGLFLFIALIVISLNIYDSSNLNKIEEYLKSKKCENTIYSKGNFKAFCDEKILVISNSFILDIEENTKMYNYKDIKSIKIEKQDIIINEKDKIRFKEEKNLNSFYNKLENKIKN